MTEKFRRSVSSWQETLAKEQCWGFHFHKSFYFSPTDGSFNQTPNYVEGPVVFSDIQTLASVKLGHQVHLQA